ncbi:MAG: signal peptidase I [Clostridiales bacterium]|nr:signal peptidase I [Clostridiales bacterium]
MKKHNREQENIKPEKHSWFHSKKDIEETSDAVEETVEETVEDAVEDTAEDAVEDTAEDAVEETVAETVGEVEEFTESVTNEVDEVSVPVEVAATEEAVDAVVDENDPEEATEEATKESDEDSAETDEEKDAEEDAEEKEDASAEEEDESDESDEEEDSEDKDEKKDKEESEKEKSALYMFLDTIKFVAIGLLIGILLVVFVVQRNDVYGSSMEPTLYSGDAVFVEMISVYTGNFDRGDIVTIDAKGMEGYSHDENLIKRIIGLPGETIKIADGNVYINGQLLDESDYLPADTKTYVGMEGQSRGYDEITLGPDEYYCMGDNRGGSNDSRRMGPFKKSQIDAKVLARIYPFNKIKFF